LHLSEYSKFGVAEKLKDFVEKNVIRVLNVAGSRVSKEPGIKLFVREVLNLPLKRG